MGGHEKRDHEIIISDVQFERLTNDSKILNETLEEFLESKLLFVRDELQQKANELDGEFNKIMNRKKNFLYISRNYDSYSMYGPRHTFQECYMDINSIINSEEDREKIVEVLLPHIEPELSKKRNLVTHDSIRLSQAQKELKKEKQVFNQEKRSTYFLTLYKPFLFGLGFGLSIFITSLF